MNDVEFWKEFNYNQLFEIERGRGPRINSVEKGTTPFITATESNNGLNKLVEFQALHKGNCITVNRNGSIGEAFYQKKDFCSTEDVHIFYPINFTLTENIAFFIITLIKKEKYRFGYGRKWGIERMKKSLIKLPVDINGVPNWSYMESYIESLKNRYIPKLPEIKKRKIDSRVELKDIRLWKLIKLNDYFEMFSGKYYSKSDYSKGTTPLISTSDTNNGIMEYTDLEPVFGENTLTIGKIGISTFYQKKKYVATSDVTVLKPKFDKFNQYIGLFVQTIIRQEKNRWSYGRQIRLGDCKNLMIKLPVNVEEVPDWEYMEIYIKSLPYTIKI